MIRPISNLLLLKLSLGAPTQAKSDFVRPCEKAYRLHVEQIDAAGLSHIQAEALIDAAQNREVEWFRYLPPLADEAPPPSILDRERPCVLLVSDREAMISIVDAANHQHLLPCKIGAPDKNGLLPLTLFATETARGHHQPKREHTIWLKPGGATLIGLDPIPGAPAVPHHESNKPHSDHDYVLHFLRLTLEDFEEPPHGYRH